MMMNKPVAMTASVITNRAVAEEQFLMSLRAPAGFPEPAPGQFVMLRVAAGHDPLLRRPFSIHAFDLREDSAIMEIIYRVAGRGTKRLSRLAPDAEVSLVGPLGHGFTIALQKKNIIIIAGGMGMAPLSFLAEHYLSLMRQGERAKEGPSRRIVCYVGARSAGSLSGLERIEGRCGEIRISTDDGSLGHHGTVVELFRKDISFYDPDDAEVYACGPAAMLKELAALFLGRNIRCHASMEERMACGIGACLGCVLSVKGLDGKITYKRVCKDGPVFNLQDLVWTQHGK